MTDLRIDIVHDAADQPWATDLRAKLADEIDGRLEPENRPELRVTSGLEGLPDVSQLGPLSLVLLVLPAAGRGFLPPEQEKILALRRATMDEGTRLIPVASEPARNRPPSPLDDIVSFKLHDLGDAGQVGRLATLALNLLSLRVAGSDRSVFVSYKVSDGKPWAERIADGLVARGYEVWRDELLDRDGQALISPGSPAQKTIQGAILKCGFVLVIDSPQAPFSSWVQEEVSTAISYLLPVLPVVIEDPIGGNPQIAQVPRRGGRFRELRELQDEVRITNARLDAAVQTSQDRLAVLDDAFFDALEDAMNERLLAHLRSRRRLIFETRRRFESLRFSWAPVSEEHLLFRAETDRDSDITPCLRFRVLVQCAPYETVLDSSVRNLCSSYLHWSKPDQFCVLIHPGPTYPADRRRLLTGTGGHVMLLNPGDIDRIPTIFQINTSGGLA